MTTIYFLQDLSNKNIKIGRTNDLKSRMSNLQVGNSNQLRLSFIMNEMEDHFENHIHGICNRFHIQGEWFKEEVLEHLFNLDYFKKNMIRAPRELT